MQKKLPFFVVLWISVSGLLGCSVSPDSAAADTTAPSLRDSLLAYLPFVVAENTNQPTPSIVLEQNAYLYSGPGNADYQQIEQLFVGETVTPTAVFNDFVRVTTGNNITGFLWHNALPSLPTNLPLLTTSQVPQINKQLVPTEVPLVFDFVDLDNHRRYPIFGTAMTPDTDLSLTVDLAISEVTGAAPNASSGLYFGTEDGHGLGLFHQNNAWRLFRYDDGNIVHGEIALSTSERNGRFRLSLSQNNQIVTATLPDGSQPSFDMQAPIFDAGAVALLWVQVGPSHVVVLNETTLDKIPTGDFIEILALADPLRDTAERRDLDIGTIPDGGWIGTILDHQLVNRHNNLMIWHLNWNETTTLVTSTRLANAFANNTKVRAHPLIWFEDLPDWLENGSFTPQELSDIMENHITILMNSYEVAEWVVVNEAIANTTNNSGFMDNVFYRAFGEEYVDMAFRFARAADPDAYLLYNDYGIELPGAKADRAYNFLERMIARGTPIDAVGLQYHLFICDPNPTIPTKEQMLEHIHGFAELGLDVHITELDINLFSIPGTTAEKWAIQAQIYEDIVAACAESGVCKSVTTWGSRDNATWIERFDCADDPLIFDDDYTPKPAVAGIERGLDSETAVILPTASPPIIDHLIDAIWQNANTYPINNPILGTDPVANDLSGNFKVLHDNDNLYLLVEVEDDVLQNDSGDQWWQDDAIELYIDGDNSQGNSYDGSNDRQLIFRWNDDMVIAGPNSLPVPPSLRYQITNTAAGYRLETAVPLAELGITGHNFSLDIHLIDDDDSGEREAKLAWHSFVDENWQNPSLFGNGRLAR